MAIPTGDKETLHPGTPEMKGGFIIRHEPDLFSTFISCVSVRYSSRPSSPSRAATPHHSLAPAGLTLRIFDGYRPVRATLAMVAWTEHTHREDLLRDGYIASRSRHNLGLAIDLTLADRATGEPLEMGTPFDTFSADAHTANATGLAAANRARLNAAMSAEGFTNYDQEWWHFTFQVPHELRFDLPIT
jgi:zinc D-Ala-D-Ala dipeptidase